MKTTSVLSAAALCLLAACADTIPLEPSATTSLAAIDGRVSMLDEEQIASVSATLGAMNEDLERVGAVVRVGRAQLIYKASAMHAASKTEILANDRDRGFGEEWVKGDPRRGGREGVTYALGSNTGGLPVIRGTTGAFRFATPAEVNTQIEEGMDAWRNRSCSSAPIVRVPVPAGTDPDQLDQYFRGQPTSANYAPPADIVQAAWHPLQFFVNIGGPDGVGILGVTFTFYFVDASGAPTDIDGDGNRDLGLAEIFYNGGYLWGSLPNPDELDFFSIIAHESGHALGLNHFGKIFVTKKAASDGIQLDDIKYAPLSLMNALYITGRSELRGTDNSSFCQIWASKK
jgi:hypothetical protein